MRTLYSMEWNTVEPPSVYGAAAVNDLVTVAQMHAQESRLNECSIEKTECRVV